MQNNAKSKFPNSCIQLDLLQVISPLSHIFSHFCGKEYTEYVITHMNSISVKFNKAKDMNQN